MLCFTLFSINNIYIFFYRMASKCRINKTPVVLKQRKDLKKVTPAFINTNFGYGCICISLNCTCIPVF